MKSARHGKRTLVAEVTTVSINGFRLLVDGRELFVPFKEFPWFLDATIGQIVNVQRPHAHHLYWPDLDIDLALESIEHPELYPLISTLRSNVALPPPRSRRRSQPARGARPADS